MRTLGAVAHGLDPDAVVAAVVERLRIAPETANRLVRSSVVVGAPTKEARARDLKKTLLELGVMARVERAAAARSAAAAAEDPEPVSWAERRAAVDAFLAALPSRGAGASAASPEAIVHACRALVAPGLAAVGALLLASAVVGWIALVPVPAHLLLAALWVVAPAALVAALAAWLRVLLGRDPGAGRLRPEGGELPHVRRLLAGLGERLSVPVPETLELDVGGETVLEPEAGLLAPLRRRGVLVLGLALLRRLEARELAAVLAAELARAAPGRPLRTDLLARAVDRRLAAAATGRDPFLERCAQQVARDPTGLLGLPVAGLRVLLDGAGRAARTLHRLHRRLTEAFLHDAAAACDRRAAALVGRGPLEHASRHRAALRRALVRVEAENRRAFADRQALLEDLPAAVARLAALEGEEVGSADAAPTAGALAAGAFSARRLCAELDLLDRRVTQQSYARRLGLLRPEQWTVPNERILPLAAAGEERRRALKRFFLDVPVDRFLCLEPPTEAGARELPAAALHEFLLRARTRFRERHEARVRALDAAVRGEAAARLAAAGLAPADSRDGAAPDPAAALAEAEAAWKSLARIDRLHHRRLALAVEALPADVRAAARQRLAWLEAAAVLRAPWERLARELGVLEALLAELDGRREAAGEPVLAPAGDAVEAARVALEHALAALPEPAGGADGAATDPGPREPGAGSGSPTALLDRGRRLLARVRGLYLGELGALVEPCLAAEAPLRKAVAARRSAAGRAPRRDTAA